jgi:hippurate hydrolase
VDLSSEARDLGPELTALRRRLHTIPEVGLQLPATQQAILDELDGMGLEISTGTAVSSVTAVLRGGRPGPAVLLRGDMDGLPIVEATGESFAPAPDSAHHGAMHACGHDLHMAGLVGATRLLAAHRDELAGDVVLMFQPGEEGFDGASYMIDEGVLDAAGARVVGAYGLHVFSKWFDAGVWAGRAGSLMAASAALYVKVIGAGGHGSSPHLAKDPIPAAAEMVTALQTMVTRTFDAFDPVVVTVGSFHAGSKRNIIPADAVFEATVRSFSADAADKAAAACVRVCENIAAAHGLHVEAKFVGEYPLTRNDPDEWEFTRGVIADLFGEDRIEDMPHPLAGSEDFSRVLDLVPGAYVFLGATVGPVQDAAPNHSPQARYDDAVLPEGAALLAELAVRRLARETA